MAKICTKCKILKDDTEFNWSNKAQNKLKSECRACQRTSGRKYAAKRRITDGPLLNARTKQWEEKQISENPNYYKDKYYQDHERNLKKAKKYYDGNKEKCLEAQKKWRQENPETAKQSTQNWRKNHPEQVRAAQKFSALMYRGRRNKSEIQNFSDDQLEQRMSMFNFKCAYCPDGQFECIDHLIPLSKGGKHCLSNLRPSCKMCNNKKYNKTPMNWFREIGKL